MNHVSVTGISSLGGFCAERLRMLVLLRRDCTLSRIRDPLDMQSMLNDLVERLKVGRGPGEPNYGESDAIDLRLMYWAWKEHRKEHLCRGIINGWRPLLIDYATVPCIIRNGQQRRILIAQYYMEAFRCNHLGDNPAKDSSFVQKSGPRWVGPHSRGSLLLKPHWQASVQQFKGPVM